MEAKLDDNECDHKYIVVQTEIVVLSLTGFKNYMFS